MLQDRLECDAKCCGPYQHLDKQSKSSDKKTGGYLRVWVWLQTGKTWPTVVARQWRCVCRVCSGLHKRHMNEYLSGVQINTRPYKATFLCPPTIIFAVIVDPSFRLYQLGSIRTDIHEVLYWGFWLKSVVVIRLWLESEKNESNFVWISTYIYIYVQGVTGGTDQTSGGCSLC